MAAQSNVRDDRFPPEGWKARLSGTRFCSLEHVEVTGSTNADLVARAGDASDGVVLVAEHQTAGRGRLGRVWEAPTRKNLLVSALLRPNWPVERHPLVTSSLAVAVVDALDELGVSTSVKWPNDLIIREGDFPGKLAGILAEHTTGPPEAVVVGLGFNLGWPGASDHAPPGATSIQACGYTIDRWELLVEVLTRFDSRLAELTTAGGVGRLRDAHLARSATVGGRIRVETPSGLVEGIAMDIALDGSLLVRSDDGGAKPLSIAAADVTLLRSV